MPQASKTIDQQAHRAALKGHHIRKAVPEKEYDDIVKLATIICSTPIALINIMDAKRPSFKAKVGMDAIDTPRELVFCPHAMNTPTMPLIVEDTLQDARFSNDSFVQQANIRFYAGYPLTTQSGQVLGTLCTMDNQPRALSPSQKEALKALADSTVQILEYKQVQQQLLNLMNQLTRANTKLDCFAYAASHDMQEPIRTISNFSQIIAQDYEDKLDDDGREYLRLVGESAKRMRSMISDLLEYAKTDNESNNFIEVNSHEELNHVLKNIKPWIDATQAVVTMDPLPNFYGDPVQFVNLLQNLISNGLKFQPRGNIPRIHISTQPNQHAWCFTVQDNGIGIDPAYTQQIFEPFKRLHHWEAYPGTGLGLALCQHIIENHEGEISVSKAPQGGSIFCFTISKGLANKPFA